MEDQLKNIKDQIEKKIIDFLKLNDTEIKVKTLSEALKILEDLDTVRQRNNRSR